MSARIWKYRRNKAAQRRYESVLDSKFLAPPGSRTLLPIATHWGPASRPTRTPEESAAEIDALQKHLWDNWSPQVFDFDGPATIK